MAIRYQSTKTVYQFPDVLKEQMVQHKTGSSRACKNGLRSHLKDKPYELMTSKTKLPPMFLVLMLTLLADRTLLIL